MQIGSVNRAWTGVLKGIVALILKMKYTGMTLAAARQSRWQTFPIASLAAERVVQVV